MSFEAVSNIAQAEAQAKVTVAEGESKAKQMLEAMGVTVLPGKCDELLTVQEMAGFQMILCKCCDTCAQYLAAPANAPYWTTR